MNLRVLLIGDVVGAPGQAIFQRHINNLRHELGINAIIVNGENEWEVEQILDSQIRYKKLQYKAQWKNHPLDNT